MHVWCVLLTVLIACTPAFADIKGDIEGTRKSIDALVAATAPLTAPLLVKNADL